MLKKSKNKSQKKTKTYSLVSCLQFCRVIIAHEVFYAKYNLISYCTMGHVLFTITKNLIQFCNVNQFMQGMNKACHMPSIDTKLYNIIISIQIIIEVVRNFYDARRILSTRDKRIVYVIILITTVTTSHSEATKHNSIQHLNED